MSPRRIHLKIGIKDGRKVFIHGDREEITFQSLKPAYLISGVIVEVFRKKKGLDKGNARGAKGSEPAYFSGLAVAVPDEKRSQAGQVPELLAEWFERGDFFEIGGSPSTFKALLKRDLKDMLERELAVLGDAPAS